MEHRITHACGHEQVHYLTGFSGQQDRKARWLATTSCKACFVAHKRTEEAVAAATASAAVAHLALPPLTGTDRQVGWATSIRASRVAAIAAIGEQQARPCLLIDDAKWWIDARSLADADLLARAQLWGGGSSSDAALRRTDDRVVHDAM